MGNWSKRRVGYYHIMISLVLLILIKVGIGLN